MSKEREEQIRDRAYQLWEADGAPEDRAEDYWIQAEGQIDAENGNGSEPVRIFVCEAVSGINRVPE